MLGSIKILYRKIRDFFVISKVYYQRALGYISLINSSMILFILLSNLEKYGIDINIQNWFVPILVAGVVLTVLVGYIDDKLGVYTSEIKAVSKRNPHWNAINNKLDKIEKEIKTLKK